MNNESEISALKSQVSELRAEVTKLREALEELREYDYKHWDMFTKYIAELMDDVTEIRGFVLPYLKKVYPNFSDVQKQIEQVFTGRRGSGNLSKKSD